MSTERKTIPLIPLRGITVFPNMMIHFDIGREKSLKAIEKAMLEDQKIFLVTQKDFDIEEPTQKDIHEVGCIVSIKQVAKLKPPVIKVLVEGDCRAKLVDLNEGEYLQGEIEILEEDVEDTLEVEALIRTVAELFSTYAELNPKVSSEMVHAILGGGANHEVIDLMVANMHLEVEQKQQILEMTSLSGRMKMLLEILQKENEVLAVQKDIMTRVKKKMDKNQKEYYLKEQLKVIQEELGEEEGNLADAKKYKEKLEDRVLPEEVREKLDKEINRLTKMSASNPESNVVRSYIENVLELPWDKATKDNMNLAQAKKKLEEGHYGLNDVKERVLDYLAVRKFTKNSEAPILCLVGPPGVGKTSIAKAIAEATNREEVRISLGGVRDESEIRGHRRTYVGAMPGRFVQALKTVQVNNPVMVLDEIDKMAGDFRGDPAAALLEVLDQEQNSNFRDHYLELPLDLSDVMFVATANSLSTIPKPLLDRMEIIEVSSYTKEEKVKIGMKHLLPKQLAKHQLTKSQCKISEQMMSYIVENYTRESGVRNLSREIENICRKAIRELLEKENKTLTITKNRIHSYLGAPRYTYITKNSKAHVGVVRGLAWTAVGGDTLSIEVNTMKGKGNLQLTGNMGDVMKESASAATSYIRARSKELEIPENFYKEKDIHIHIPEGAVPKDGPSAGITMATAIISALKSEEVRNDIAMTGEITIRGRVLAIGGVKEKILAAKRAGIFEIIIPKANKRHVEELEESIKENINIIYVDKMQDVLKNVFA